jgi:hypothetical protein
MANNILATGVARFSAGNNAQYLSFEYNSVIVGENSGKSINLSSDSIVRNYYNTFVGYGSGRNSAATLENTFIGYDAGTNIQYGSNNILVGRNYNNQKLTRLYDAIGVGINNKPGNSSIIFGTSNLDYGNKNIFVGLENISQNSYQTTHIGTNNITYNLNNSLIFGNNNVIKSESTNKDNDIILLGNHNTFSNFDTTNLLSSSPIFIGNDLYETSNYTLNIDDTFLKYDNYVNREIIQFGPGGKYYDGCNIQMSIGFGKDEIYDLDEFIDNNSNYNSLYVKSGIYADSLSLGSYDNISNYSISISATSNLTSNIEYILPDYPYPHVKNPVLSTNENGEMFWKQVDISNNTTDTLRQGTSNLYYNQSLVDARMTATFYKKFEEEFAFKMSQHNTDNIIIGTSNKFIENGIFNSDMYIFGTLTVNRLRVLGIDVKNDFGINDYIHDIVNTSINKIDDRIDQLADTLQNYTEIVSATPLNSIIKSYINTAVASEIESEINYVQNVLNVTIQNNVISELNITGIPYKNDVNSTNYIKIFDISVSVSNESEEILEYSICAIMKYNSSKTLTSVSYHKYFIESLSPTITTDVINKTLTLGDVIFTFMNNAINITNQNNKVISILSK